MAADEPEARAPEDRVQLVDSSNRRWPVRTNPRKRTCGFAEKRVAKICDVISECKEGGPSKILGNAAFGYWMVPFERPLRIGGRGDQSAENGR